MSIRSKYELREEAFERIKEVIMEMNSLTDEAFMFEYLHNPNFHNGINVLVQLFLQAKFDE